MKNDFNIGPCRILVADNIEDPFGDWVDLGSTRGDTTVTINDGNFSLGRTDQTGVSAIADAVHLLGQSAQIVVPLIDKSIEKLQKIMPTSVIVEDSGLEALGFGSDNKFVTPVAVALIPTFDFDENDVRAIWKSHFAHWVKKAYINLTGQITFQLPEGEDVLAGNTIEVTIQQVTDFSTVAGAIGSAFLLENPISVMGSDSPQQLSVAVPDSNFRSELGGESVNSVQSLAKFSGSFTAGATGITDATGIEWMVNADGITLSGNPIDTVPSIENLDTFSTLGLADGDISEEDLSQLVDELWRNREALGANSAVIAIEGNNGLSQQATDQVEGNAGTRYSGDGLTQAGVTVTY